MKILIVVDSINIEDSSGSKANVALIKNLQKSGFEVIVYHYTLKKIDIENVTCVAISEIKYHPFYFLSRLQRVLVRNFNIILARFLENKFGFSFTFFNDVLSIKKAINNIDFVPNLVITLSKGASFRPHYAMLKLKKYHKNWLAYIHDPYPHYCYPKPYQWADYGYKHKISFFKELSMNARFTAFPSLLLKEWMGNFYPNMINTGLIIPHQNGLINSNDMRLPSFFDLKKFNVLHAGNLLKERTPNGIIDGYKLFLKQNPVAEINSQLTLIGHTDPIFENLVKREQTNNTINFINSNMDFDTVFELQTKTSVNVILEANAENSPFLPAKFAHYIAANKKILCLSPQKSETKRLLGDEYEFWSTPIDVIKIAKLIENLYLLWIENPNNMKLNRYDLEHYLSEEALKIIMIKIESKL